VLRDGAIWQYDFTKCHHDCCSNDVSNYVYHMLIVSRMHFKNHMLSGAQAVAVRLG